MNAIFEQKYTLELFIALKMAYYCCFGLKESRFPPKKSFITSTTEN